MKRIAALLLLAGVVPTAHAADPKPGYVNLPTTPQVAPPVIGGGGVVQASGIGDRITAPFRGRSVVAPVSADAAPPATTHATPTPPLPLPTGYATNPGSPGGWCVGPGCPGQKAGSRGVFEKLNAWLCFQPTTRDALPKFQPTPYVGPITGTFPCAAAGGCATGCAPGSAAALAANPAEGKAGPLGSRFASPESPAPNQPATGTVVRTAYRPATAPPVPPPPAAGKAKPAALDALTRPLSRP